MSSNRFKLVLKPETPTLIGIKSLNVLQEQPYIDGSGNIDMSANFVLVKNIEAGTQNFTTNGEKGIINVYSDSSNSNVSCVNFKHDITNIIGNNRRYSSFQPNGTNFIAGSITGNPGTVSFNTTSDLRLKTNIKSIGSVNNGSSEKYSIGNDISFNTWLSAVNQLKPCIFEYNSGVVGSGNEKFTYKKTTAGDNISVNYQGFIAGEVQEVYPPAVTGISGEIGPDGSGVYQQLDVTKLIPMMVGSIQELNNRQQDGLSVSDGTLDISSNTLRVKNIETGTEEFTTNGNKGVINVFSDSNANNVANINLKNTNTNIALYQNGNNRSYTEFQTVVNASNITSGIISGDNFQTVYGSLMDQNLMQLCDSQFGITSTNDEYSTGKYSVPDRNSVFYIGENSGTINYNSWLDQINALEPYTYYYTSTDDSGKFNAAHLKSNGTIRNARIPFQGFLGSNVLDVYPPAVINSSPDSSNNQYVDMSKLVPMCIGAIKQLDASNNSLTSDVSTSLATINEKITDLSNNLASANTKITVLETLNLLNSWQINGDTATLSVLYTSKDGGDGFYNYLNKRQTLTSVKWGASQYNSSLTDISKNSLLSDQLTIILSNNIEIPSDTKFIYDFSENIIPGEPENTNYTYSYYTVDNGILQVEGESEQSGRFGLIYNTTSS